MPVNVISAAAAWKWRQKAWQCKRSQIKLTINHIRKSLDLARNDIHDQRAMKHDVNIKIRD